MYSLLEHRFVGIVLQVDYWNIRIMLIYAKVTLSENPNFELYMVPEVLTMFLLDLYHVISD